MTCPTCSGVLELDEDELDEGDPVTCEECGAELKVASVHPLELEAADVEEDEEDEDEDFDEEDDEDEEDLEEEEEDKDDEWS